MNDCWGLGFFQDINFLQVKEIDVNTSCSLCSEY